MYIYIPAILLQFEYQVTCSVVTVKPGSDSLDDVKATTTQVRTCQQDTNIDKIVSICLTIEATRMFVYIASILQLQPLICTFYCKSPILLIL